MAVFGKDNKKSTTTVSTRGTTTIANGTRIEGEMVLECNLNIDGYFEGKIMTTGGITVGKNGRVKGNIIADKIVATGLIQGTTECNTTQILAGGRIEGELITNNFIVEDGGNFEGSSKKRTDSSVSVDDIKKATKKSDLNKDAQNKK